MIDYGAKIVIGGNAVKVLEQISRASANMQRIFEQGSKRVSRVGNEIAKSMDRIGDSVRRAGEKMRKTFSQTIKDVRQVRSELAKLKPKFSGIGSTLAGFGVTLGAADVARRVYRAGTTEENTYARLKFALGSDEQAAAMMARLKAIGRNSTSPISQIYQNAGFLAPVFKGETDKYLKLFSEVVAGSGGDFGNIAFNFSQIKQAGKPELEDIKQFAYNNIPIFEELGKVLGVSVQKVRELQTEGKITFDDIAKAFENMTKKGGIYYGALEAQANTFSGKMQIISNKLQDLFVKAFDKSRPYLDEFSGKLENMIDNFDEYVPKIKAVGIAIAGAFSINILVSFLLKLNEIYQVLKKIKILESTFNGIGGWLKNPKNIGKLVGGSLITAGIAYGTSEWWKLVEKQREGNLARKFTDYTALSEAKNDPQYLLKMVRDKTFGKIRLEGLYERLKKYNSDIDFELAGKDVGGRNVTVKGKWQTNVLRKTREANEALMSRIKPILDAFQGTSKSDVIADVNNNTGVNTGNSTNGNSVKTVGGRSGNITINITAPIVQIDSTHIDNKQYTAQQIGEIAAKELVNIMAQVAVQ